jgi:hypothetical protein
MAAYGQISWDDAPSSNQKKSFYNRDKFAKLVDGINTIRFVTNPYRYFFHKLELDGDTSKYPRNIRCAAEGGCPLCAQGLKQHQKYIAGVINKTSKQPELKYLEFGTLLFNQISGVRELPGMKDLLTFDLLIRQDSKSKAPAGYYQTFNGAQGPLNATEVELVDSLNLDELEELCKPLSPEEVTRSIERIKSYIEKNAQGQSNQPMPPQRKPVVSASKAQVKAEPVAPQPEAQEDPASDGDEDFVFKTTKK